VELITSDELAKFVSDAVMSYNQEFFIDGEAKEFFEVTDIVQEGPVLTITTTNVSRTRTLTFIIGVHGG
jgi:hypothetical protein